jgi:outer membrane receptor for ferrienterochelin and colicin
MKIPRWMLRVASPTLPLLAAATLSAQGVTTGAIAGTVTTSTGPVADAQVQVTNRSTGYSTAATTRDNGYYFVQGLEVGGPYTVRVRRIGLEPTEVTDIQVTLSRTTRVDVVMRQSAQQLAGVVTTAERNDAEFSSSRQGAATVVADTLIRRLPTLQRDFTDLVKLTPQVVPNAGGQGPSAAGGYNRLNNFTVDGANQNDRFNLGSTGGQPGGATGGRIMSQEAVKEFQVLLSPTDVRYGNFAGMTINAVTKSGTNEFQGGATYTFRTPYMAANVDQIRSSGFKIRDYGFHLGGPIIKDRLHFFIAPEWQERTDPTTGPILNSAGTVVGTSTVGVSVDSLNAFINALAGRPGFPDAASVGSFDKFSRGNPITNLMGRLDWSINDQHRAVFRILDNTAEQDELSRTTANASNNVSQQSAGIRLTSNAFTRQAKNRSIATQFLSNWSNGMSNELMFGYNTIRDVRIVPVTAPEISLGVTSINLVTGAAGTPIAVTAGTERFSPGNDLKQKILEISDNFTIPFNTHTITLGGRYEYTDIYNFFLSGAGNGAWLFPNLNALTCQAPTTCVGGVGGTPAPSGYAFSYANGGDIAAKFRGNQISAYVQDLWNVTDRLSVTAGIRADMPDFLDTPKFNVNLDTLARNNGTTMRTDWVPKKQVLWSPRIGMNWDVTGRQTTQVRANAGVFTGNTPYILIGNAFANTGLGGVTVGCTGAFVPAFSTDVSTLPTSCQGQPAPTPGNAGTIGVNLNDPNFKYPQNFTTTFGIDHWLPWQVLGTFEALYRKDINALMVRDLNLIGPRLVGGAPYRDVNGRVLYADTILAAGTIQNANQKYVDSTGVIPGQLTAFSEGAIFLTNAKAGHSYTLTGSLKKRFSRAFELTGAYTYMQAKDVQSLTSDRAISNWRNGRQYSGFENDPKDATTSNFQRPHRFIAYGTYTLPWKKNQTDISMYMERMSGMSITYVTNNDINGDGINANDPIYVPLNAADPAETRIGRGTGAGFALNTADAQAFDRFISMQSCLDKQRGSIMKRNSCQAPMTRRMDINVRQTLVDMRGQQLSIQWDVFNFPNLINKKWGQNAFPILSTFNNQAVLNTAGKTAGALDASLWNYNVPTGILNGVNTLNSPWSTNPNTAANNYQMQLTVRYSY